MYHYIFIFNYCTYHMCRCDCLIHSLTKFSNVILVLEMGLLYHLYQGDL